MEKLSDMPKEMAEQKEEMIPLKSIKILDEVKIEGIKVPDIKKEKCLKGNKEGFSAIYSYKDENGIEKYQIVKTINGRQPYYSRVAKENGEYDYGIPKSIPLIPYNLDEVNKAIEKERPIFIVEGESKADTINSLGLVATTAPFQNINKWNNHYSEFLCGAKAVIILADNDEKGRLFAENALESVKETLENTEVAVVGINEIYANIKEGGDIDDLVELAGIDTVKATLESIESQF